MYCLVYRSQLLQQKNLQAAALQQQVLFVLQQQFFFQVCKKTDGAIIRLEPISEAEKTPGVKRLMGQVAFAIRSLFPGSRYGKNNISDFLPDNDGTPSSARGGGKKLRAVA